MPFRSDHSWWELCRNSFKKVCPHDKNCYFPQYKFTSLNLTDNNRSWGKGSGQGRERHPLFSFKTVQTFTHSKHNSPPNFPETNTRSDILPKKKTVETLYCVISNRAITDAERKFEEQIAKTLFHWATENWKRNKGTIKTWTHFTCKPNSILPTISV